MIHDDTLLRAPHVLEEIEHDPNSLIPNKLVVFLRHSG